MFNDLSVQHSTLKSDVHTSYAPLSPSIPWNTVSHMSLVFSRYTHEPLGECVYLENTSDKKIQKPKHYETSARVKSQHIMGRLRILPSNIRRFSCILIGRIFYGLV